MYFSEPINRYIEIIMNQIYLAPLEGVTDNIYRKTFDNYYGGVDKYFTPFLSPNSVRTFTTREFDEIDPSKNDVKNTVPQLLTNASEPFLWAAKEIFSMGFHEINFNLGCPSGTVVAKKKGSGLLFYPDLLDHILYDIFEALPSFQNSSDNEMLKISIKTRLGKVDPEEFYELLDIFNKYPIFELTIHPRIQSDFYKEPIRRSFFDYAMKHTKNPLVFNGEIKSSDDISSCFSNYDSINAVMIGRGLISNPSLARDYKNEPDDSFLDRDKLFSFHDDLLSQYKARFSGDKPVLHRMKELWSFWEVNFPGQENAIKKIKKAKSLADYQSALHLIR